MTDRWRSSDGAWHVEVIRLTGTPDKRDGEWIRVRYCGYYVADVNGLAELDRLVPLTDLEEALTGLEICPLVTQNIGLTGQ